MNEVIITGNLTRNPEYHELESGTKVCNLSIAVQRDYGEEGADFFSVKVWNKQAELCQKFLVKGRKVGIVGRLQNRSYEDNNGAKHNVTEILARSIEFLSSKEQDKAPEEVVIKKERQPLEEISDNDLPF